MAGDWIPFDHDLPDKAEVLAIMEKTGTSLADTLLRLCRMWIWFDRHTLDGKCNAFGVTGLLQKCGGDKQFWGAVAAVGWLLITEDGLEVPKFAERFGSSARRRLLTAKRVAIHRGKKVCNAKCVTDSVTDLLQDAYPQPQPHISISSAGFAEEKVSSCLPVQLRTPQVIGMIRKVMQAYLDRGNTVTDIGLAAVNWALLHGDAKQLQESGRRYLANQHWKSLDNYARPKDDGKKSHEAGLLKDFVVPPTVQKEDPTHANPTP